MSDALAPDWPARCLEHFRPIRRLGEGGSGVVWLAEQLRLRRQVALKLLQVEALFDPDQVQRFHNEARVTAALSHPSIVVILDHGVDSGVPWIAYEFLPGRSLEQLLEAEGPLGWQTATAVMHQVASAVDAAHARQILHRDLKPANVLEVEPGRCKVTDFGIAKWLTDGTIRTRTGVWVGTPAYMAPELLTHAPASPQSDVWSLGLLYYELLTGELPFRGFGLSTVVRWHRSGEMPAAGLKRPGIPAAADRVIEAALEREPTRRMPTAAAFAEAVAQVLRTGGRAPSTSTPRTAVGGAASAAVPAPRPARRLVGAGLALLTLGAVALEVHIRAAARAQPVDASVPTAPDAALASVDGVVARLDARFGARGARYVEMGRLMGVGLDSADLDAGRALGLELAKGEEEDLAALAGARSQLELAARAEPRPNRALSLAERLAMLTFLDWERLSYCRYNALLVSEHQHEDTFTAIGSVMKGLTVGFRGADGVTHLRAYFEALNALLVRVGRDPAGWSSPTAPILEHIGRVSRAASYLPWKPDAAAQLGAVVSAFHRELAVLPAPAGPALGKAAALEWELGSEHRNAKLDPPRRAELAALAKELDRGACKP